MTPPTPNECLHTRALSEDVHMRRALAVPGPKKSRPNTEARRCHLRRRCLARDHCCITLETSALFFPDAVLPLRNGDEPTARARLWPCDCPCRAPTYTRAGRDRKVPGTRSPSKNCMALQLRVNRCNNRLRVAYPAGLAQQPPQPKAARLRTGHAGRQRCPPPAGARRTSGGFDGTHGR